MPNQSPPPNKSPTTASTSKAGPLAGVMSAGAAAILLAGLVTWEGDERKGYLDIAGIPTKCSGDTTDVVVGKMYTEEQCRISLEKQASIHAKQVLRCTPALKNRDPQFIAASLLAYNIGGTAYCRSTAARQFNAGNWKAGCAAFAPWNKARVRGKLVVVRGLANRRAFEMKICYKGL